MRLTTHKLLFPISAIFFLISPAFLMTGRHFSREFTSVDSISQREIRNASAFATILGEFRTNINDILFIKTERYLHSGVAFTPHIDSEALAQSGTTKDQTSSDILDKSLATPIMKESVSINPGTAQSHDDNHSHDHDHDHDHHHDHSDSHTVIPSSQEDFRGFIGDLERQVKPWQSADAPHTHTAGTELLPWYRIATLSDPHGIKNYMIGAWWLKSLNNETQTSESLKFLDEGIRNNSTAYELYLMRGYVYRQLKDEDSALESFKECVKVAQTTRPPLGQITENWDETDEEQFSAAVSMAVLLTRESKGSTEALNLANQYSGYFPPTGIIDRIRNSTIVKNP